jgi:hypothetical protein
MRQRMTVSQLIYKPFPECTKVCSHYGNNHDCYECKLVCGTIKEVSEQSIIKIEMRESLLV